MIPYAIIEKVADRNGIFARVRIVASYETLTEARAARERIVAEAEDVSGLNDEHDYAWVRRGKPPNEVRYFIEPLAP